ncbi:MAG: phage tail protein [Alphaproteobacteria bacterium]|nr:phage tail protein [Alphaproteobacteria bacterium]
MSQPYVGQILMFAGTFPPAGWALCQGQLMPISENDTLFNLIGTTYGGDGQSTFGLPNLSGRIPIHQGTGPGLSNYTIGQEAGTESVTLTTQQIPSHNHLALTSSAGGTSAVPQSNSILADEVTTGQPTGGNAFAYLPPASGVTSDTMPAGPVVNTGGSQPHENIQPILTISYCISLFGVYPSPT